ncbi:hypothetical protein ABKV19_019578 [Rosa sericea]
MVRVLHRDSYDKPINPHGVGCCMLILVSLMTTLLLIDTIVHQALNPEEPQFWVDSAAVTGLELTGSSGLTATWNMTLVAHNPNRKLVIDIAGVQVFIYFGKMEKYYWYNHGHLVERQHILATKLLPSFFLYTGNQTSLDFKVGVVGHCVDGETAKEVSQGKTVKFGVFLHVEYKYRTKVWLMGDTRPIKLLCDQVEFLLLPNTNHHTGVSTGQFPCRIFG